MGKLLIIVGFVLALTVLGFAAANADAPASRDQPLRGEPPAASYLQAGTMKGF